MHPPRFFACHRLDARRGALVSGLQNELRGILMRHQRWLWLTIFRGAHGQGGAATTGGGIAETETMFGGG